MHRQWAMSLLFLLHPTLSFCVSQFKVDDLPGSPPLPRSWAGRLPVPDTEQGNSLFFWLFETEDIIYDDNLISKFSFGWKDLGRKHAPTNNSVHSLVCWRTWLLISCRIDLRKRAHLLRGKLYEYSPKSILLDKIRPCPLCRPAGGHWSFYLELPLSNHGQ